jgi:hypothetical protein
MSCGTDLCRCRVGCEDETRRSTNPDDFAESFSEWVPGQSLCPHCGKPEPECFCVTDDSAEVLAGMLPGREDEERAQASAAKLADMAREVAGVDPESLIEDSGVASPALVDLMKKRSVLEQAQAELNRTYRVTIDKALVDGVTVFSVRSTETTDDHVHRVSGQTSDTETYIGRVGLNRLINDLKHNLEHFAN